ncbi:MAG: ATP-dependent RecD-like DNA helicase [Chlorobium phaeobacteroides]|uniref:ATP-dependent RecD2 DNA helicase n=1 Tax=Chlorobium phaeobacteroides (strain BS1) TaxID=331678 RepID=B3ENT9_CHLPB|nr:ATP-dependent RecD-like DNA helicase [Chlorobium phaeobacteroides]
MQESLSADPKIERLAGTVERIVFHSDDSGFSVLRVRLKGSREPVTVTGCIAAVSAGEFVESVGEWINDRTYGLQFKASEVTVVPPATVEGIEKYLASGMVKGVGQHFAKELVRAFGEEVFSIIEKEPETLLTLPGIGKKRMEMIVDAWKEQQAVRDIMVFLQSHGVGTARAVRIYKTYGDQAVTIVSSNPYRLVLDIQGIGFKTADAIASKLGTPSDSPVRARAGVRHVLGEISAEGHCAATRERLVTDTVALLGVDDQVVDRAIKEEIVNGGLVQDDIKGIPCLYLASLYRAESSVAASIRRLIEGEPPWGRIDAQEAVQKVESLTGLVLSASQEEALRLALESKFLVITGGPGVGKTTLVNAILSIIRSQKLKIALCAPTGRAAKRLTESTGLEAKTIHRLLEFDPHSFDFKHSTGKPLTADLVVVDESSMIDVTLMSKLLAAVQNSAALILVGDADQLPSVGPGAVLDDVIASDAVPVVRLTEIFRQAAESEIISNAHRINRGEIPCSGNSERLADFYFVPAEEPDDIRSKLLEVVLKRIPSTFGLDPVRDIQVLTPMNRGGLGTISLNAALQKELNPNSNRGVVRFGTSYSDGDKVIQLVNNYDKEVFNGDIGVITSVDEDEKQVIVDFDKRLIEYEFGELDELALAYATSIHKSQGSEYPAVVIPLAMQHFLLLRRTLLYTAVTRGKKLVMIIGQQKALGMAVGNSDDSKRVTNLAEKLRRQW